MGDSLARTPMNHRAKFDAASFILAGEIRNRTDTQNYNNKKQTVNDISTPCLSACVDNEYYSVLMLLLILVIMMRSIKSAFYLFACCAIYEVLISN